MAHGEHGGVRDLDALPKAELHLHVEGTLEPELALRLAERHAVDLGVGSVEELRARYDFRDLPSFLDLYYATMAVLRTEDDFYELATSYLTRAHRRGVRHLEMFFDPQAHEVRGVGLDTVLDGLRAALADAGTRHGTTGGLILCFLRDRPVAEAAKTLAAAEHRVGDLVGVGLDSAEVGHPPGPFADVFARARELGLRAVAHAGEEGGPEYVWSALDDLGAERIDHGIRATEDGRLAARLVRDGVPLTVCPLSNVRLRCVSSLPEHPVLRMLDAGMHVTVNSDDPAYFGGDVGDNFAGLRDALGMSDEQAAQLARNAVRASFAAPERQERLLAEIDAWSAS